MIIIMLQFFISCIGFSIIIIIFIINSNGFDNFCNIILKLFFVYVVHTCTNCIIIINFVGSNQSIIVIADLFALRL